MTQTTDYHGWTIPTENGDTDQWDTILNNLINGPLEASVALRGPLADRPADAPADALYHATDREEFYRYDGRMGQWVNALAHVDEARQRHDGKQGPTAVYQQVGAGSLGDLRHTQQTVGTRRMAAHWPLYRGGTPGSLSYQNTGTKEIIQVVRYGWLEQPPNMVPVLRASAAINSSTGGEIFTIGLKLNTAPAGEYFIEFESGPDHHDLVDEQVLSDLPYGSAGRGPDAMTTAIEVHANPHGGGNSGTLNAGSMMTLEWEVV